MIKNKKLLKKLKADPKFNPFNNKFDYDYVLDYIKKNNSKETEFELFKKAYLSYYFNKYYITLIKLFNETIKTNNISTSKFVEIIITLANRNFYLVMLRSRNSIENKTDIYYDDIINSTIKSNIPEMGFFNVQAGLEAIHDSSSTILNFSLQQLNNEEELTEINLKHIDNSVNLLGFTNIYTVVKSVFDMAIWEDYSIKLSKNSEEISINCINQKEQILNKIGQYRLEKNIFYGRLIITSKYNKKNNFYSVLETLLLKNKKGKRLKKILINDNKLTYKLADGIEKDAIHDELLLSSDLTSYYPFIQNELLPNFDKINLYDIFSIYSEIKILFQKAFEIKKYETSDLLKNFNSYRLKIKKTELINYIYLKTRYSKKQIIQILNMFTEDVNKAKYFNIWERYLIEVNDYIFPVFFSLLNANTLRSIDYWLEYGGFDLDERGLKFEKYLKSFFNRTLKTKDYYHYIPKKNEYENNNGETEEIDLIIELQNITIIAEVKSIKFPFGTRDFHNMRKRLNQGAIQINRKVDFLINNKDDFDCIFLDKKIIKVVITNYPIFSGYILNGVPIIDISLIDNYFMKGSFDKGRYNIQNNKEDIFHSIKYYNNEQEFSDNLENFINKPIPIYDKINAYTIEKQIVSYPKEIPKIKMDYINAKDRKAI